METLNLHSLILEELSEALALTYAPTETPTEPVLLDPAVQRILAQCPSLPSTTSPTTECLGVRQLNGILALAKLVGQSQPNSMLRAALLPRLLAYVEALSQYQYSSGHGREVSTEQWFLENLMERMLRCAAQATKDEAQTVLDSVWAHVNRMVKALENGMGMFAGPALVGTMKAVAHTSYRFNGSDVLQAQELAMNIGGRLTGQLLVVLRAVLESRLAVRLVTGGSLDAAAVQDSDPRQLWELIAQVDSPLVDPQSAGAEELKAYEHILALSLRTLDEARAQMLNVDNNNDSNNDKSTDGSNSSSIMYRSMYTAALSCMLLGRAEPRLLAAIQAHLRSPQACMASVTQVGLRVLAALAAFFPTARAAIVSAATTFITAPPQCAVDALATDGCASPEERALIAPAADALVSALRQPGTMAHVRVVSAAHTLFGALATSGDDGRRGVRVARSVALALTRVVTACDNAELTALVVGMLCAPRFSSSTALLPLALQCAAEVAPIADCAVFADVAAAALKQVRFGDEAQLPVTAKVAARVLAELAGAVAARRDAADALLAMVLRAFVDAGVEMPMPARFKRRAVTPLSVYLPVLRALSAGSDSEQAGESSETVDLWRDFWFHVVARGYLVEPAHAAAYGATFAALAAKAPVLVHASSVNYLETELAFSSVLRRDAGGASAADAMARMRSALLPLMPAAVQPLVRGLGFAQLAFVQSVHSVETARAAAGSCAAMLRYFSNAAVASSALLPAIEGVADSVVAAYVRETTTRRWAVDSPPAGDVALRVKAQVRELMIATCHHLELVSRCAQRFADAILQAFPQAVLDGAVVCTLLELVQLVWKSCKAEQDDQFVPVYWFTSSTLGITLQLPDSIAYRKTLFARVSGCARRWLEHAGRAAPMELETLLQAYLATPSDDDLNCEPHVGHALALEVGNAIRYGMAATDDPAANASPFAYRLGLRDYLRGFIGRGTDVAVLKRELSAVYSAAVDSPDAPQLPEQLGDVRAVVDRLHHATHSVLAGAVVDRELVRLLVWVPLTLFDERLMRAAAHMWTALIVERPEVEVLLMVEVTVAWQWLVQQHRGLFAQRFEPKNPFAARMSYTPSDKSARARAHAAISRALAPHTLLIEFITQRFDSVKHLPDANFSVISATLRILQATFDSVERITTNALARGPLFMLVHLGFKLLNLGFESSPVLETTLRDGLYRMAFRWFALPPRWSFSGSKASVAREIQVLVDTRRAVRGDSPLSCTTPPVVPSSASAGSAKQRPHSRRQTSRGIGGQAHPGTAEFAKAASASSLANDVDLDIEPTILGVGRDQLRQRAKRNQSLLLLLLENEICRMATWANPTGQSVVGFPDVSRFARNTDMTDAGWQNLVLDAWVADPRLAVHLPQRFSHQAVRRELTGLVCKFPGELVRDPDALPLLMDQLRAAGVSPKIPAASVDGNSSDLFSNLAMPLTFRELKFIAYWSAVPPITSAAYLASPHVARCPLALQYSMRALESFPVDVTFFYIPQLVQALRHDVSGYVERAILSSAQISQLFAHQIIWNMKANMYKDEESTVPDALKPTLDRIVQKILDALSGDDRQYYEKEFGFFNEVTGISGKLKPFIKKSKVEKKRKIDEEMRKIRVEPGVYLPSNPEGTVVDIDYDSGRPLQSHAKAPFMATFVISRPAEDGDEVQELLKQSERTVTPTTTGEGGSDQGSSIREDNSVFGQQLQLQQQQLPVIEESRISIQIDECDDEDQAEGEIQSQSQSQGELSMPLPKHHSVSDPVDAEYLSSKLVKTKIDIQRTNSSAISDAPDLIGIAPKQQQQQQQQPHSRSSREYSSLGRSHNISPRRPSALSTKTPELGPADSAKKADVGQPRGNTAKEESPGRQVITRLSAIFKVGDDCRQDVLALQLIAVFKNIFTSCGLDLYLFPYRVVATAPGCGVIDFIPNSISRDQMGREKVNSLSDYFATRYHGVDSIQYQQARSNFVQSLAAYSVLSYLLQFKDRHNGNIMLDDHGHIVHIDFGFILDIAPGGITFESAPFKLTAEYIQVMGGSSDAQPYKLFCELCVKAYLASRPYAERIISVVALMLESGLPCFKGESTLVKLRNRFQLDKTERDAAQFMADRIQDSYENRRTVLYDQFQKATNGIPY
ncbi:phosphatidylinositol-4- kinase [Coemansia sp. RSA 1722]|nr:phosphatidylinositol-4- kinase [Coemansia sp. RSA 486]KAJ2232285.1 phosphatidylinositol-4- kinase [Coemansia sp. RSA 485]KAJ2606375.1 phosphatidylinositol-4- kinase [Coemansia sp. RSA 1722]